MAHGKRLIIVGDSAFAQIAYEYFTCDSEYEVVAFAVERAYLQTDTLCGLPVVPIEELTERFESSSHSFYAAIAYGQRNALRERLYKHVRSLGYTPASYISSRAFVWRNCQIGEHVFIFESNVVQPFTSIGSNVVLWSGNHIGHHSSIDDNCFFASHVVVSGFVNVGSSSFLGVNSTISNNVTVGRKCTIGAGALVLKDVDDERTVIGLWRGERKAAQLTTNGASAD